MSPFLFSVAVIAGVVASQIISLIFQSYLPAYAKEKGKNLATHEDIQKLVEQVKAVTQATKKIEADISTGVWDRQKRWELQRDVLFEVGRKLIGLEKAILSMSSVYQVGVREMQNIASEQVHEALKQFDEARFLVEIVCTKKTTDALGKYALLVTSTAKSLSQGQLDVWSENLPSFDQRKRAVMSAIQLELTATSGKPLDRS